MCTFERREKGMKFKMKKWNKIILIIISIIGIIFSFFLFYQNKTIININNKNRDIVMSYLNKLVVFETGRIENVESIKKVGAGNGWIGKYHFYIYYSLYDMKELELYVGDADGTIEQVRDYILENGCDLDIVGLILLSISLINIYILIIKKKTNYKL